MALDTTSTQKTFSTSHIIAFLLAVVLIFPKIVQLYVPLRLAVLTVGVLVVYWELHRGADQKKNSIRPTLTSLGFILLSIITIPTSDFFAASAGDPFIALNAQRFILLPGLFLCCAYAIHKSRNSKIYVNLLVLVGAFSSLLALYEQLQQRWLIWQDLSSSLYQRGDGSFRSVVAGEHPLVLGTVLASLTALVHVSSFKYKLGLQAILLAGCAATGSRGPLALGLFAVILTNSEPLWNFLKYRLAQGRLLLYIVIISGIFIIFVVLEPVASGASGSDYSGTYRLAITSLIPSIISEVPFGYIFGQIPPGIWLLDSELYGVKDLALTVDSELVLLTFSFGILGFIAYVAIFRLSFLALFKRGHFGLFLFLLTVEGLVLAIHAFDSLGPLYYLSIGLVIYSSDATPDKSHSSATSL
jgi:hypothetical protein